jgi:hypothetical protein
MPRWLGAWLATIACAAQPSRAGRDAGADRAAAGRAAADEAAPRTTEPPPVRVELTVDATGWAVRALVTLRSTVEGQTPIDATAACLEAGAIGDVFEVTRDGVPVPFVGRARLRGPRSPLAEAERAARGAPPASERQLWAPSRWRWAWRSWAGSTATTRRPGRACAKC